MNSTFLFNSDLTNQAKPVQVLNSTHLLLCLIESEGYPNKCLTNEQRRARREFETILCPSKNKTGQEYSRSSLLGFRNSTERHFIANNGRSLKLTGNPVFARSNKMLESKLKALRREGKENVQHKAVIESQDLIKLNNSPFTGPNTPAGLLRKVCFFLHVLLV